MTRLKRPGKGFLKLVISGALLVVLVTRIDIAGTLAVVAEARWGSYSTDELMSLKNKEYKRVDVVAAGMVDKVGEAQCIACHNSESPFVTDDYVFDFETSSNTEGATHENYPLKYNHD